MSILFISCQTESNKFIGIWNTHNETTGTEKVISIEKDGEYYIVKKIEEPIKDSLFYTYQDGQFNIAPIGRTYQLYALLNFTSIANLSYSEKSNQIMFFNEYYQKAK